MIDEGWRAVQPRRFRCNVQAQRPPPGDALRRQWALTNFHEPSDCLGDTDIFSFQDAASNRNDPECEGGWLWHNVRIQLDKSRAVCRSSQCLCNEVLTEYVGKRILHGDDRAPVCCWVWRTDVY